jgi:hypothetical protein
VREAQTEEKDISNVVSPIKNPKTWIKVADMTYTFGDGMYGVYKNSTK